jgi:multiple sugar transport system substrate-binding protein
MRVRAILLAAALALAPLGARAADILVWWEGGYNPEEDQAVRELVAAFEQKSGKKLVLVLQPQLGLPTRVQAALEAGSPPDLLSAFVETDDYYPQWAYEGRLVDLADALGPLVAQFDRDALDRVAMLDTTTGRRGLYALPTGRITIHVHAWKSLLARAGLTLQDVPRDWEPFWSFWCDTVQPAVRRAVGRDDVWGIGLPMSVTTDTNFAFEQFVHAYEADYVTREGQLVIDEPSVRDRLVKVLDSYTAVHRKGCTPPDAVDWDDTGNNKAFLAQRVAMTPNGTLSIPSALRTTRPDDYYKNVVTLEWPNGAYGQPLAITTRFSAVMAFKAGGHGATAKEFVRFLVGEGWLAHWLDFAGDRFLPPLPALLEQPFWLDTSDPHRMASALQFLTRPRDYDYAVVSGKWRYRLVSKEAIWPKAIHRIVVDGLTPERAADEAIARVHQLLSE